MKLFGIEDLNDRLPLLKSITKSMQHTWAELVQFREQVGTKDLSEPDKAVLENLVDNLNNYIKEVEDLGCFVHNIQRGILTMPSLCLGRKVLLIVQPKTELKARFFIEIDETFADRQLINRQQFLLRTGVS